MGKRKQVVESNISKVLKECKDIYDTDENLVYAKENYKIGDIVEVVSVGKPYVDVIVEDCYIEEDGDVWAKGEKFGICIYHSRKKLWANKDKS